MEKEIIWKINQKYKNQLEIEMNNYRCSKQEKKGKVKNERLIEMNNYRCIKQGKKGK